MLRVAAVGAGRTARHHPAMPVSGAAIVEFRSRPPGLPAIERIEPVAHPGPT